MGEPGFWDDQERAAKVSAEHARAQRKLDSYRTVESEIDDLETLEELEAEDDSIAGELATQGAELERRLAEDWSDVETVSAHRRTRDELQRLLARWETLFEAAQA